jgi:hypothetical protein
MADTMDLLRLAEAVAHTTKDPTTERLSSILEARRPYRLTMA